MRKNSFRIRRLIYILRLSFNASVDVEFQGLEFLLIEVVDLEIASNCSGMASET
ncbi:hypothetical protein S1OALGB6SA_1279 [Olavius algarvensis spirochete endosymbiont]|uniref:hypothetical protein n=1 Tax=Olavius algarvensis spirochete endosymbiont TaxID=260710 RepID=UPI000F1ACEB1|nr:hypothetical protein [Olavius algarvensis spirochete endosymbiont]VDB00204.1 hypothetical protein S1OALGB6SA_1279 [Olavius algarvensis spirochete endosymbiont]